MYRQYLQHRKRLSPHWIIACFHYLEYWLSLYISSSPILFYQMLSFDLTLSSKNLRITRYSKYQYNLYTKITYLQKQGMNYVEIVNWLNRNIYKRLCVYIFKNNHVQSKRISLYASKCKTGKIRFSFKWRNKISWWYSWFSRLVMF